MNFKVGDKVRIRDLSGYSSDNTYDGCYVTPTMKTLSGAEGVITAAYDSNSSFQVRTGAEWWCYLTEMLEVIEPTKSVGESAISWPALYVVVFGETVEAAVRRKLR